MSGRWTDNALPWSSLLVLDHAISSTPGFEWEQRPSELNDLRGLDLELDATQDSLRALIEQAAGLGIDNEALEAALEATTSDSLQSRLRRPGLLAASLV